MKKVILLLLLILSCSSTFPLSSYAQTPTPDPLRDSVKAKVDEQLSQIKQAVAKRGFVGQITAKSDAAITLSNYKNQTRALTVTPETIIKLANGSEGTSAALKIGDYILAMGDVDSQNTMTVKRLLIIAKPVSLTRKAISAAVSKVSASSLTADSWTVKLTSATEYTAKTKAAEVKTGSRVVIIGTPTGTSTLNALLIKLLSLPPVPSPSPAQ